VATKPMHLQMLWMFIHEACGRVHKKPLHERKLLLAVVTNVYKSISGITVTVEERVVKIRFFGYFCSIYDIGITVSDAWWPEIFP